MSIRITRSGITWEIDGSPTVGKYVNGDWWVVGPVTINSVSPARSGTGATTRNGSMVNWTTIYEQAFDGDINKVVSGTDDLVYDETKQITYPYSMSANESLISVQGTPNGVSPRTASSNKRFVEKAAVLTCVTSEPASASFRPSPFQGTSRTTYLQSSVDYTKLLGLPLAVPDYTAGIYGFDPEEPTENFQHFHLDMPYNGTSESCGFLRPTDNIWWYPGESGGQLASLLTLAHSNIPEARVHANTIIQIGIDYYTLAKTQNMWPMAGAGFGTGKMWPIIFAGVMLGVTDMMNIATTHITPALLNWDDTPRKMFGEQYQVYLVDNNATVFSEYVFPRDESDYPDGLPLWGQEQKTGLDHDTPPGGGNHSIKDYNQKFDAQSTSTYYYDTSDVDGWNAAAGAYMTCCSAKNNPIPVLFMHLMGYSAKWDWAATVEFADRWANDRRMWRDYDEDSLFKDDIYGFGGKGNYQQVKTWQKYRGDTSVSMWDYS